MAYLAPIHRPSSVRNAIKLNLLDAEQECLVLGKGNRLEIWGQGEEGLILLESRHIYGGISMLAKIRPPGSNTDHLFVGTLRFHYFTIAFDPETRQLETQQKFVDVSDKHLRDSQSRDLCLVDPTGQYLVLELFEGILNLVKVLKPRKGRSDYLDDSHTKRISELRVRATTFLYTETKQPKIAFLIEDGIGGDVRLVTYRLVDDKLQYKDFDATKDRENDVGDLDLGSSHLIPIPKADSGQKRYIVRHSTVAKAHLGGVIVVGETKFTYLDDESKVVIDHSLDEPSIFVAWERFDDLNYLIGDTYGRLHILTIEVQGSEVVGMDLRIIGKTSKATVMVNLGEGAFFIGSHEDDSQIIKVSLQPMSEGVTLLQTMANVAPILDFTVMDMGSREGEVLTNEYSTGQARLVTGSGVFEGGSLRSVRSGVGLEDVGILADDMQGIRGVFSLKSSIDTLFSDTLVVSLPFETRVFRFEAGEDIEEVDSFMGMAFHVNTLLAINLPGGLILQVTTESAKILGPGPRYSLAEWKPPPEQVITAASANFGHVLVSSNGSTLISLDIQQNLREVAAQPLADGDQIACLHVPSQISNVGVVGFWKSGSISILNLQTLEIIFSEDIRRKNDASIPRGIAMTQIFPSTISGPTLFIAMEDGVVLTFNVDPTNFSLSGRKSIVLGTQQAQFNLLPRKDGTFNVFATCEHPSLIYGSEGRIVYSAVTAEHAVAVCAFDSAAYPGSIVVATSNSLTISNIDTERRTHVTSLRMGQTVRRIEYAPSQRAFGIGCLRRELRDGEEFIESTFSLVEDIMFSEIGKPFKIGAENGPELIECITRADVPALHGSSSAERFIIGTSFLDDDSSGEDVRGRILVFGINSQRSPYLVCETTLKSACRQIAMMGGKVVAALNKTVVVYQYIERTERSGKFVKLAAYRCATVPISISVTGDLIAIADMMQSVSIVKYTIGENGLHDTLEQIARHYQSCWATAVADIGDDSYLETDHDGNLLVLRRNVNGVTLEDRKRMEVTSEMNLGEQVNMIRKINVEPGQSAMVAPKAFMATTEGSIYLFSIILPKAQDLLMRLQNHCAAHITTLGEIDFKLYRSFKNNERETLEPFRFVDGELIERFLDVGEDVQEKICRGLGPSVEDVRNLVEELKRLH